MAKQIFINLPVKNLDSSIEFFTKLGFSFDSQFTDKNATCMIIGENMFAMLLTADFFKTFSKKKEIADTTKSVEVINAISFDSKEEVDEMMKKAFAAGGKKANDSYDHGFMYGASFEDLDGHVWEFFWMDASQMPKK